MKTGIHLQIMKINSNWFARIPRIQRAFIKSTLITHKTYTRCLRALTAKDLLLSVKPCNRPRWTQWNKLGLKSQWLPQSTTWQALQSKSKTSSYQWMPCKSITDRCSLIQIKRDRACCRTPGQLAPRPSIKLHKIRKIIWRRIMIYRLNSRNKVRVSFPNRFNQLVTMLAFFKTKTQSNLEVVWESCHQLHKHSKRRDLGEHLHSLFRIFLTKLLILLARGRYPN